MYIRQLAISLRNAIQKATPEASRQVQLEREKGGGRREKGGGRREKGEEGEGRGGRRERREKGEEGEGRGGREGRRERREKREGRRERRERPISASFTSDGVRSFTQVYNWQYVNCLRLWAQVLCAHAREPSAPLRQLVYPLVQVTQGAARLLPSIRFAPLRLQCVRVLNQLCLELKVGPRS